jgi:hypothetical protein
VNSRERLLTAIGGGAPDHVPLICRVFGFAAPAELAWEDAGGVVPYWYTMRLEHIHTLPIPWNMARDFRRADAWLRIGLDDVLEVSPPWSIGPDVAVRDYVEPPPHGARYPIACREYTTPDGLLTHKVHRTREDPGPGWVVQPEFPPLFEDYNIPRHVRPPIVSVDDVPKMRHLLRPPTGEQRSAYQRRMHETRQFASDNGVLVCGWSLFGFDAVVWLCGAERAVMMAMTELDAFQQVVDLIDEFDRSRTEFMLEVGGVDLVVQRGWYSSTDFWSPDLFRRYVLPKLKANVERVHAAGAKFAYVMTTGVKPMAPMLAEADIDLFCWADPVQGDAALAEVRGRLGPNVAIAGGVNASLTLGHGSDHEIRAAVRGATETLGPERFILEPVDSLYPETPWSAVRTMIDAWKECTQ